MGINVASSTKVNNTHPEHQEYLASHKDTLKYVFGEQQGVKQLTSNKSKFLELVSLSHQGDLRAVMKWQPFSRQLFEKAS